MFFQNEIVIPFSSNIIYTQSNPSALISKQYECTHQTTAVLPGGSA